jgi:hypothetical protein
MSEVQLPIIIDISLDRDDIAEMFSGRVVSISVDEHTVAIVRLDLDGGRRDPPEAREFLPVRRAK